ncbi:cation:proton antiporter [Pacificimonas flava]|uniref:Putative Glutathione-regulated potassium-efflux system protein KefB n=1 Tax=Pacificimonas flava TaxID=1234595 RepID=M2TLN1_9SPHN|nr:cation:proton antiporter [Pacificimonas flava]EMD82616.1 putative Glutathione-regulated potassium-efflux system protein KefB [Pacificimonas flava]MBB5281442.1 CPA2 family monovalent cation:H+ antiporter-2 [Pacificimonas flava]
MASESIDTSGFRDALLILGSAGLVIPAFARARVNPVIGFILVGLLLGPILGYFQDAVPWLEYVSISNPEVIEPFAEFGIILLLFGIGLELSLKRLWELRKMVFLLGTGEVVFGAGIIGFALTLFGYEPTAALALGLALALSSTALVLPMTGTRSPVGRAAFSMLLFEDVALVPIVFGIGVLGAAGGGNAVGGMIETLIAGGITVAVLWIAGRFILPRLFHQAARTKRTELFMAATLVVVMAASLATSVAGIGAIMGALIAGLIIAETEYRAQVELLIDPFKNLALGIFLITIGMSVRLDLSLMEWLQVGLAVVLIIPLKALVTSVLLRIGGASRGLAANTGILMSSPSETTLIVLTAAAAARIIDAETASFWQIVTAIGLMATPLLARLGRRSAEQLSPPTEMPEELPPAEPGRTIIAGYGRVGRLVGNMLEKQGEPYAVVDANIEVVRAARDAGLYTVFGDLQRHKILELMGLDEAKALVLTMDDPVQVVKTTRAVRDAYPNLCIVARARDSDHAAELYRAGATDAVPETLESSLQLAEAVLVDIGRPMGPVIASIHEMREIERNRIKEAVPGISRDPLRAASRIGMVSGEND